MSEPTRTPVSRRNLITAGAATTAAVLVSQPGPAARAAAPRTDPFTLGVASGEPTPDGIVLWTRLAIDPLAEDGLGGMPPSAVEVEWEIATDERFAHVVQRGTERAVRGWAHSVHAEVDGLEPSTDYWYRFRTGKHLSPAGRTRTAPRRDGADPLDLAVVSCSHYAWGYWTAYRHLAEEHPDLVLHVGDYFYEGSFVDGQPRTALPVDGAQELHEYRRRYAQYHLDEDLQAAHAAAPFAVVFDDHEVVDDWYADDQFIDRRTAGFRAFYENLPLRSSQLPSGSTIPLYRRLHWGRLTTLHLLDTRQYRDKHACDSGWADCPGRLDPDRSILGMEQEQWLADGFAESTARWDVLGQQVPMRQMRHWEDPNKIKTDKWDGYAASRDRVLQSWQDSDAENLVVLDGDVHQYWVADLKTDWDDPDSETIGAEITGTSISSGSDGEDVDLPNDPWLQRNPHIKYHNMRRGYVMMRLDEETVTAHLRGLDHVTTPGAPLQTRATFTVEAGVPGIHPESIADPSPPAALSREENGRATIAMEEAD